MILVPGINCFFTSDEFVVNGWGRKSKAKLTILTKVLQYK